MTSVVVVMVIMPFFVMVVMIFVFVMVIMFVVAFMVIVMEGHVECSVFCVNFYIICVLIFINEFDSLVRPFCKRFTQVRNKHSFVIKGCLSRWHGVYFNGGRCIRTEGRKCCLNPGFKSEPVVEEDISVLKANQIRSGRFVIVYRDIVQAHVFHCDIVSSNSFDKFSDVVCRNHHGPEGIIRGLIVVRIVP